MRGIGLALVILSAPAVHAAVEIRPEAGGKLSLRADAPASEILDRLASQTGMKVVYEGGAPRTRVNVSFENRTQAEAVLLVLEGLGYDYLVRYDRSGTRAELLLVSGPSSNVNKPLPSTSSPTSTPAGRPARPVDPEEEDEEEAAEEAEEEVAAPSEPAAPPPHRPQAPNMRPAFGPNATPRYPVSPFAPNSPGLPTVVTPPSPAPEGQAPVAPQPGDDPS